LDETGSGPLSMARFGFSGVEPSESNITELININFVLVELPPERFACYSYQKGKLSAPSSDVVNLDKCWALYVPTTGNLQAPRRDSNPQSQQASDRRPTP